MRFRPFVIVPMTPLLLTAAFALAPARADDSASEDPLKPFGRFVGGAWESEGDFKVRVVYDWGINNKLLKIKSYLIGKEGPQFVYESGVYYHPEKKEVVFQSVSASGGLFDGVMTAKDNVFSSVFTSYDKGKVTPFRQTIEFHDDDHVTWTVFGKKGDNWEVLHKAKESRVRTAETK